MQIKLTGQWEHEGFLCAMARDRDTGRLYCGGSDSKIYEVDLGEDDIEPAVFEGHSSYVTGIVNTGESLVSGGYDRQLIWWNRVKRAIVHQIAAHEKWIRGVCCSPDGTRVASIADDMACRLWDAASAEPLAELRGHAPMTPHHFPSMLHACAFSADGSYLATGDKVGHVVVWDVANAEQMATLESPEHYTWDPKQRRHSIGGVRSLAFSSDSKYLAVGGIARIGNVDHLGGKALVQVYDWSTGERIHKFEHDKHKGLVQGLNFAANDELLFGVGGANKGILLVMNLDSGRFVYDQTWAKHLHEFEWDDMTDSIYAVGDRCAVHWEISRKS